MKGDLSPEKRSSYWKSKRVFFVTPQVLENDIQSGDFPECVWYFLLIFIGIFCIYFLIV
jgi:ERCC4-related helicase